MGRNGRSCVVGASDRSDMTVSYTHPFTVSTVGSTCVADIMESSIDDRLIHKEVSAFSSFMSFLSTWRSDSATFLSKRHDCAVVWVDNFWRRVEVREISWLNNMMSNCASFWNCLWAAFAPVCKSQSRDSTAVSVLRLEARECVPKRLASIASRGLAAKLSSLALLSKLKSTSSLSTDAEIDNVLDQSPTDLPPLPSVSCVWG
jgi:hypothetical protein